MRAVVYVSPNEVRVDDIADPVIEAPGDAIVEVSVAAICGTDLHAYRGRVAGIPPGTVLGHEFVGRIVEVGPSVDSFRVGDPVFGSDFTACGRCWWCRRREYWQCPERQVFGYGDTFGPPLPGAQAEYVRVPFADVVLCPAPPACPPEVGIFTGDTLATGYCAAEQARVCPGDVVAVVGGGAVGQMVSLACQAFGAAAVIVIDPLEPRRGLATDLGALTTSPEEARPLLNQLTDGRGADVVIEAVGGPEPLRSAFLLVRGRGRIASVGAHFDTSWPLPVAQCFEQEITVGFLLGDPIRVRDQLLILTTGGVIDPLSIVSERVALDAAPDAYRRFNAAATVKPLLLVGSPK